MEDFKDKLYYKNMRILIARILSLLGLYFIVSCAQSDREIDGPVFCTIDQSEVYQVGTNPTVDFNVTNLTKTISFNETDCPNVNKDSFQKFVSRVKRQDDQIQIFENQYQANQFLLEMEVTGNNLLPVRNVLTISNCSIIRTWRGTLDSTGNTLTLNQIIEYRGGCRSTFYDPEFDKTSP